MRAANRLPARIFRKSREAFYKNNKLDAIVLMSNGQIQQRIIPDVTRILEECPNLNVTVALGIDGLKEDHESIRQKPGSWDIAIDTARKLQAIKKEYPRLDIQTCTCFMNSNQDRIFDWYDFLKYDLKPDKVNINLHPSAIGAPEGTDHRQVALRQAVAHDQRRLTPRRASRTTTPAMPDSSRPQSTCTCTI